MSSVACPACARAVDPLRAGHVAIFEERFHYFCDRACRELFLARQRVAKAGASSSDPALRKQEALSELPPLRPEPQTEEQEAYDFGEQDPPTEDEHTEQELAGLPAPRSDTGTLLLLSATVAGVLAVALALIGTSSLVLTIRLAVACVGVALLVTRAVVVPREPSDPHPAAVYGAGVIASLVAVWARVVGEPVADEAAVLTGLIVVATGTSVQLVEQVRRETLVKLACLQETLDAPARRVIPAGYAIVPATSLRPGEEVLIDSGEMVPTDVMISAGEATVLPWFGAKTATRKSPGDAVVAGAKLISGRLRATVTWTGEDRAWLRTTTVPAKAAHVLAPVARAARQIVERWALASAAVAGLAAFVNNAPNARILLAAVASHAAIASVATVAVPAFHVLRGLVTARERGIVYQGAAAWERAAQATVMVFSARGTLLLGEPQVAEMVGLGTFPSDNVLALATGAQTTTSDPVATALGRAARARKVQPDAVRSPTVIPGLGLTAVTSNGEPLCVGSRALMLREHISVATVEDKLAELEAHGRAVLLVAVASRLRGYIALQDGLRPGARAAVQYLLDGGVEPVLLSGDARETCDAIARSLDIEHVRPEVLPSERAAEVRSIAESGATVAVVGRPTRDESVLGAADVAVALEAAGSTLGEWAITLAGDDIRDAARSVVSARRMRAQARASLILSLAPGVAAALAIAFGLLPPAYAPLAVLIGALAAHLHARAVETPEKGW